MIICGIDPGQTGALAFYSDRVGRVTRLYDMPVMTRLHGKGMEVNASDLCTMLMAHRPEKAIIELVAAMPGQGVSSMFRFGESYGIIKGVLATLQIPYTGVTPQSWKKAAGLSGKDKDASRTLAIQQHPEIADMLSRKKDCGRADAIHIAKS